jgi:predicted secreted acid phosphatase
MYYHHPRNPEDIYSHGHSVLKQYSCLWNPAVIFDVDKTLIDIYEETPRKITYSEDGTEYHEYMIKRIEPIVSLWDLSGSLGYTRIIVTARTDENSTARDLKDANVLGWDTIFVRDAPNTDPWVSKAEARDWIYDRYTVVMNIGDSCWDIGRRHPVDSNMFIVDTEPIQSFLVAENSV